MLGQTWTVHSAQEEYSVRSAGLVPGYFEVEVREHDEWINDVGRTPERNRAEIHLGGQGLFAPETEIWWAYEETIHVNFPLVPSVEGLFEHYDIGQWHTIDPAPTGTVSPFYWHEIGKTGLYKIRYRGSAEPGHAGTETDLLIDDEYQYGGKYRFVTKMVISQTNGIVQVWRRKPGETVGTLVVDETGLVIGFPLDTSPYPKRGYYGSAMTNTIRVENQLLAPYGPDDLSEFI